MKISRTGKPLCCRCRKLAISRQAGHSHANGEETTIYVYHCKDHSHKDDELLPGVPSPNQVRRADWVKCQGMSYPIGSVKRVAANGSWADVDWHTHTKRMPTSSLVITHTIPFGPGVWVTDLDRQRELEGDQTSSEDDAILADVFARHAPPQSGHPCPFCPIILPEQPEEWHPVGDTDYGEPATIGVVRSCDFCARYAECGECEEELLKQLKEKHRQVHDPVDCQCPSCNGDGEVKCQACGTYFRADGEGHYQAGEYAYCNECYCE